MSNPTETQLLEIFLKCEIEKEQQNTKPGMAVVKRFPVYKYRVNIHFLILWDYYQSIAQSEDRGCYIFQHLS